MKRTLIAAVAAMLALSAMAAGPGTLRTDAEEARRGRRREASFNFGPFFEYRRAASQDRASGELPPSVAALKTYWAFRPFYSQARNEERGVVERDFLWPIATSHSMRDGMWWRALIAYGSSRDDEPSWTFNIFPIWFSGRDRKDIGKDKNKGKGEIGDIRMQITLARVQIARGDLAHARGTLRTLRSRRSELSNYDRNRLEDLLRAAKMN